ncbi:low affinity vacuolar monovalent cation/H(+) antiporter isoform X2 [Denticeps clupeoides]|uniref:low affinity vacuolar monovalent cation/H(+) antiporter isoform X2 n=1 Tax=Denticeps clupeoides TaxID=299321 RepID=UPI0010A4284A|nr:low affinity vacuolar monovalent cation/H(+) antiporter-like isoform X2 [Denticeps clupeoides]
MSAEAEARRRRLAPSGAGSSGDCSNPGYLAGAWCDKVFVTHLHSDVPEGPSSLPCLSEQFDPNSARCLSALQSNSVHTLDNVWHDGNCKTTISAENEVEAQKLANNYKFGFRKWKSHVTERPFEERSEVVKELYSELNVIKPHTGSLITFGNIVYVFLFGWWLALAYLMVGMLVCVTVIGVPYGKLCWQVSLYFLWPFGKSVKRCKASDWKGTSSETISEEADEPQGSTSLLPPASVEGQDENAGGTQIVSHWRYVRTYVWLLLGCPLLVIVHSVACLLSWLLVFSIPVAKMNGYILTSILLKPPEEIHISKVKEGQDRASRALLCCYHAFNSYYYKYTVDGINVFAVNLLPLVIFALVIGYVDRDNRFASSEVKFATAIGSIIPLSYYIGMGIASISAQSNFAVGAVVNATFGSITEMTFYITALLRGHQQGNKCLQEIVKSALTGTLLGCILFIPGICMIIGGLRHREQRFNSRSAGVGSALLFISVGGVFAPTMFSKAYGNLVCEGCNSTNTSSTFTCQSCRYDLSQNNYTLFHSHIEPLVYSISVLLPIAYIIGLIFTLKTHSDIYDIHIGEGHVSASGHMNAVVHWSRWRALLFLLIATLLMSACADLTTEHIQPILTQPHISQYFIGITVLAMVPEIPEIVNGIQFALQNNISLSLEVGSCIAVQVCMIQIPLLILFNAFYDVGFVLIFSDLHLWASIFSVVLVNYIFMDGKSDYFQGTALVVVYLILLAVYFFAPSPAGC